ncbi:dihydrofolate reductase family protein [Mucilaginibacter sp. SMC90]|uniref:dihydrofolate reductase family protein n=1 Tax=Mucilaginibacter sp. SMC90 TaxID=2929803 RepID=UPI001FB266E1|nr:dihydrofolate reductase family protein [Mucilaginibacter sp. SMC90]UOE50075.1 dihydrofolate reductase family protein [Mucilaginibacter sp. SMC90]
MRKIILNLAVSLDGFIEGTNGEYDWCLTDQDYGMTEFLNSSDAIFIGRKSYDLLMSTDPEMFGALKMYVFSDTLRASQNPNTEIINSTEFAARVEEIRNQAGSNIWLFGGASLVSAFIDRCLITEFMLSVHPIILGGGKPLFTGSKDRVELILLSSEQFSSGLVQLRYAIKPKFDLSMFDGM